MIMKYVRCAEKDFGMDDAKILIANIIGIQKMIVMTIMNEKFFFFLCQNLTNEKNKKIFKKTCQKCLT